MPVYPGASSCRRNSGTLSYSRKGYSEAVFRQSTDSFLQCLEDAFWDFGGVPRTIVIDNLKAAVKAKHKLWSLTLHLLREHRDPRARGNDRVFVTADGNPLVWRKFDADGKYRASDAVKNLFWRLQRKLGIDNHRGFYTLRKTAASLMESIDPAVTEMYLCHAEPGMKRHYAQRDWPRLTQALEKMFEALREIFSPAPR